MSEESAHEETSPEEPRGFQPGDHVAWKAEPSEAEQAQIGRWVNEYGPGPFTVEALVGHHQVDHLRLEAPSGKRPCLPVTFFQLEPGAQAEATAIEDEATMAPPPATVAPVDDEPAADAVDPNPPDPHHAG